MQFPSLLLASLCALAAALPAAAPQAPPSEPPDLWLRTTRLFDGSGNPPRAAAIALRNGRITAVADPASVPAAPGTPVLDVGDLAVAPGFVDVHVHVDSDIVRQPLGANFLRMGVTTVITGNCGSSVASLDAHFRRLEQGGIGLNYGSLVGHGTVRTAVLGTANRAPSAEELRRMQDLVEEGMRAGAFGLSTGLIYVPGIYADKAEIAALAAVVGRHGGRYASHMRSENDTVLDAIAEALWIGEQAAVPVHISHLKCTGKPNHGRAQEVLAALQRARAAGRAVTADQYAYEASSTGLDVLFPSDELAVGREAFAARLRDDAAFRARIHAALLQKMDQVGFGDFRYARIASAKGHPALNGLLLPDAAQQHLGRSDRDAQAELAIALLAAAAPDRVTMIYHTMAEADVEAFLATDWIAVASDAGLRALAGPEKPHPRGSGNNPRVLGRYVRDRGVLPLALAVRKMTAVPAAAFGLADRGEVRPGNAADLVVFDPDTIADRATYDEPLLGPVGIAMVFVNGQLAVHQGQPTGIRAGQVLRHRRQPESR